MSVGFSGDIFIAADQAAEGVEIAYSVPKEGAMLWFDMLAIPSDAPNPAGAHAFIDYLLRPEVIGAVTNAVFYPNANAKAAAVRRSGDPRPIPSIYPTPEVHGAALPAAGARPARRPGADPALDQGADRPVGGPPEDYARLTLGTRRIVHVVLFQVE